MAPDGERTAPSVALRVLGPVRLLVGGVDVPLGAQQRTVLALLAVAEGRRRSLDALVAALWRDSPPASGLNTLRVLIRSLRRLSPAPLVLTLDHAYGLAPAVRVDLDAVRTALDGCLAAAAAHDDVATVTRFADARGLVDGEPFADVPEELFELPRDAFEELLLDGLEAASAARVRLGSAAAAVVDLAPAAAQHPLRETLQERLVRALLAAGRRAEALDAFGAARAAIVDRLGVEPGPGLQAAFAALLRTEAPVPRSDVRTGLRTVPPLLVGREEELRGIEALLDAGRLVTLVGIGGVGKTRLAQAVVERRSGSFVSLAVARADDEIAVTVASALGVAASDDPERAVASALSAVPPRYALVLDNLEHLRGIAAFVDRLLAAAPALTVLATSRLPLLLPAEVRVPVGPLPTEAEDDGPSDAATLLLHRLHAMGEPAREEELAAVERIAARCSGLPLAIELAATWAGPLTVGELADAMEGPAPVLRGAGRLHDAVAAAVAALAPEALDVLAAATAFAGGCTVDRLAAATGREPPQVAQQVAVLMERGLLRRLPGASAHRRLALLEVIRDAVVDRLSPAERERAADGQLAAMLLWLRAEATTRDYPRTVEQLAELLDERPNLRAAMRRASAPADVVDLLAMSAIGWLRIGGADEQLPRVDRALARHDLTARGRCALLIAREHLRGGPGDDVSMATLDEADSLCAGDPVAGAEVTIRRVYTASWEGRTELVDRLLTALESLPLTDLSMRAQIADRRAGLLASAGRTDEAVALVRRYLALCAAGGRDHPRLLLALNLSDLLLVAGRYAEAVEATGEVIAVTHPSEHYFRAFALTNRSTALQLAGRVADARESVRSALVLESGAPDLFLALMTTTVAACAFAREPGMPWAAAAGAADAARTRLALPLQTAERRLVERRIGAVDGADGAALVEELGVGPALAALRAAFLA